VDLRRRREHHRRTHRRRTAADGDVGPEHDDAANVLRRVRPPVHYHAPLVSLDEGGDGAPVYGIVSSTFVLVISAGVAKAVHIARTAKRGRKATVGLFCSFVIGH